VADAPLLAEIRLWGKTLGAIYEPGDAAPVFEYAEDFRRSGLEVSPRFLPLSTAGPRSFPELMRSPAFEGLPGLLADALPDRFGNAVIRKYFSERGQSGATLSPVRKLLYVGDRAMGALTFHPGQDLELTGRGEQALELSALVQSARAILDGSAEIVVPEIMSLSASAGGARAKAIVLWSPERNEMRSAFAKRRQGDQDWMIKFDGVGDPDRPDPESQPYNRIEYAYSLMAREAGIEMAETHLLEERGLAHFMTRRFDRDGDTRLHMHSLGGMEQVDYNLPGAYSYEQFFRLLLELGLGNPTLEQAFLRVAFNILTVNQDDHVKNIAFLMDPAGQWRLSPAYDLTYARGQGYTLHHQMSLANKRDDFTLQDLTDFASKFGIRHAGRPLLDQLTEALSHWPTHATTAGLTAARAQQLQSAFRC
jgi:serine/threonine-protein kinase HipA